MEENKMGVMVSYNLAIKKQKPGFYEQADIIRLNSPWYDEDELVNALRHVDKPKFLDINIKERTKAKKTAHEYSKLLKIAGKYNVDWVGISNVEKPETYTEVRKLINNNSVKVCAKVETSLGCKKINEIMNVFDGIMVDVEDLASEVGWEVASIEKERIYNLCNQNKKPHFRLSGVIFESVLFNTIIYTFGVFDLLHPGHLNMLEIAKSYGTKLVVGVVGDDAVKKLKGNDRPIQKVEDRMRIVGSLRCVDEVMLQEDYDPIPNMEKVNPDILVKGDDWAYIPGEDWIKEHGKKLIKPRYSIGWSTSNTVKKMKDKT
jgi:rfaE bifunctional protein nucleotidyltransferase chain/domain